MLFGRRGLWPFVLAWAAIVALLAIVLAVTLWLGGGWARLAA